MGLFSYVACGCLCPLLVAQVEEFESAVMALGFSSSLVKGFVKKFDADGSGAIDYEEFLAFCIENRVHPPPTHTHHGCT